MVEATAGHLDTLSNNDGAAGGKYSLISGEYNLQYWRTFLIFATMGAGASWVQLMMPALKLYFQSALMSNI